MEGDLKEVFYDKFCKDCVNKDRSENETPCEECLTESARADSHKPAYFQKKEK